MKLQQELLCNCVVIFFLLFNSCKLLQKKKHNNENLLCNYLVNPCCIMFWHMTCMLILLIIHSNQTILCLCVLIPPIDANQTVMKLQQEPLCEAMLWNYCYLLHLKYCTERQVNASNSGACWFNSCKHKQQWNKSRSCAEQCETVL